MLLESRPYVSLDLETTGISHKSQILEIGAIYDDWTTPVHELKKIRLPFRWQTIDYAEPYALAMNAKLIQDVAYNKIESYSPGEAAKLFVMFLQECHEKIMQYDQRNNLQNVLKGKIQFAGKNISGFDMPKIEAWLADHEHFRSAFTKTKMHRTIDVGPMYMTEFGYVPSLDEINKISNPNRAVVAHTAIDDAEDVILAIRHRFKTL
jgi:hypothetical protein